jgi:hypothetical protein
VNNDFAAFLVMVAVVVGVGLSFLWQEVWPALVALFAIGAVIWAMTGGKYNA